MSVKGQLCFSPQSRGGEKKGKEKNVGRAGGTQAKMNATTVGDVGNVKKSEYRAGEGWLGGWVKEIWHR